MLNIQSVETKCCREPVIAYQYCYCIISLTVLYVLVAKHKFQILGPLFKTNLSRGSPIKAFQLKHRRVG
jgi:hypothetical protein